MSDVSKTVVRLYLNRHLINMHTLLNTKLRHENIECRIEDTDNLGLTDDGAISLCQVGQQNTKEEMVRLLFSECSRITFTNPNNQSTEARRRI